jgi:hypothetical protein
MKTKKAKTEKNNNAPVTKDYTLFAPAESITSGQFRALTAPPIIKIKEMAVGMVLDFIPESVQASNKKSIRQCLIVGRHTQTGQAISVPAVAALANVLLEEADKDSGVKHGDGFRALREDIVNKRVLIQKAGIKESSEYQDDNGDPRKFPVFNVVVDDNWKVK